VLMLGQLEASAKSIVAQSERGAFELVLVA
jgi:hypothetical protein